MSVNNTQQDTKSLKKILNNLREMYNCDINYDGNSDFVEAKNKLKNLLTDDIEYSKNLIDTLNFNNLTESHILSLVIDIVENFDTLEDQEAFVTYLLKLQERFPDVNFAPAIFYAELSTGRN